MKPFETLFILLALVLCVVSCKKKQESDDIVVDKIVEKPQEGPISMGSQENTSTVQWVSGATYSYTIERSADSSRVVTNHDKQYRDNNITLTVNRNDGSRFFSKTFTKENFRNVLPEDFVESGVLTNMRFESAKGNELNFVVTVGSPDENNEDFFLVKMTLDNLGHTRATEYHDQARGE